MDEVDDDWSCSRCHAAVSQPFGLEKPEHGQCWTCATESLTEARARIEKLEAALRQLAEHGAWDDCRQLQHLTDYAAIRDHLSSWIRAVAEEALRGQP